jgi:ppGpp synthetase/RelA/SpoT-type nucleotidyltranferase
VRGINSEGVMKEITASISSKLSDVGIMFRLFSRAKSQESLKKKLDSDSDYGKGKKLQDLIGVRVVLYFTDDIDTVREIISSSFEERSKDVSIDENRLDEFKATRYNIVYSLDKKYTNNLNLKDESARIDNTFELQIRTIFSEGWHEVEHDLRYKCKSDWKGFDNQSRRLNGVYATLETSEWTMIKIFDELAYSHYKNREWCAMFRQKFRLRFVDETLDENLLEIFEDKELVKRFFRLDRSKLIKDMSRKGFYYPLKLQNLIYFANIHKIKNENITALIPAMMLEEMND